MNFGALEPSPRLPTTRGERRAVWGIGLVLGGLFVAEVLSNFVVERLSILFMLAFWGPILVLHELGHAWAAKAVGWHVSEIVIGFGSELFRFRVGETRVRVLMLPIEGCVIPSPTGVRNARLKSAFIYAAGPGIELLFLFVLWLWLGPALLEPSREIGMLLAQSAALCAAIGVAFNLFPYVTSSGMSDGLGMIVSLFADETGFQSRLAVPFLRRALEALYREEFEWASAEVDAGLERYPGDWQLLGLRAVVAASEGHGDEAFEMLEALGHPDDKPPLARVELLLDAAWVALIAGERRLFGDAQAACERALRAAPRHARANLLLGRVLLERGQPEQAYHAFMDGYAVTRDPDEETQLIAYLAIACRRANRLEFAERFAMRLQSGYVAPGLRERVSREFDTP